MSATAVEQTEETEPTIADLAERVASLEEQVKKLRGLVFAFKPKKGSS